jgi:hypothetical protein
MKAIFRKNLTFIFFLVFSTASFASTDPVMEVVLMNGDEKIADGAHIAADTDLSTLKMVVLIDGVESVDDKIVGGIIYLTSNPKVRLGTISPSQEMNITHPDELAAASGEIISIELKVMNEVTGGNAKAFVYQFHYD